MVLVQEDIDITGVLDQPHRFGHHGIQNVWQVETGGEVQTQLLERVQLIGLLFQESKQGLLIDQLASKVLDSILSRNVLFKCRGKDVEQRDHGITLQLGKILFFQYQSSVRQDFCSDITHASLNKQVI